MTGHSDVRLSRHCSRLTSDLRCTISQESSNGVPMQTLPHTRQHLPRAALGAAVVASGQQFNQTALCNHRRWLKRWILSGLQGLLTNDVSRLAEPGSLPMYAAMLNAQGRVMQDLFLHRQPGQSCPHSRSALCVP